MTSNNNSNEHWKWEKVLYNKRVITFTYPIGVTPEQVMTRLDKMYPNCDYVGWGPEAGGIFVLFRRENDEDDDSAAEDGAAG